MIDDMDVDSRILQSRTQRSIHYLPEEAKEELRSYRALEGEGHDFQRKWTDFHWPRHGEHQASGGDFLEMIPGLDPATLEAKRTEIQRNLPGFCNPCLEPMAIRDGIKHYGDKKEDKDTLWNVPRALCSFKHKYLKWFKENLDGHGCSASGELLFTHLWPNTDPAIKGEVVPLTRPEVQALKDCNMITKDLDFYKALIAYHDGEVKLVIDDGFKRFPDNVDIFHARFWDYQYARSGCVRKWLYHRYQQYGEARFTESEILWCLTNEYNKTGSYQTTILRWEPNEGINPASGGTTLQDGIWSYRSGNYLTLAELFFHGANEATCFHLYKMYLDYDYYIHKRVHSESQSPEAQRRRAAKSLHYQEHGTWRLPRKGDSWGDRRR